ncbi:hypothetical protein ATANTOWER_016920 [Ataeniobius toweri]|uniref:Uncharacterized protein n=1 Tax=Ataeniobius toweri TaxID=208326 RepID=A0ABU7ARI4_9TELE|nr:hypothetical protein [Ataeniobius toweri]
MTCGVRAKKRPGGSKSHNQAKTDPTHAKNETSRMQAAETNEESDLITAKAIQNLYNNIKVIKNDINLMKNNIKWDMGSLFFLPCPFWQSSAQNCCLSGELQLTL